MQELHPSTHRRDIDGLRAIAVLMVVIHHVAPRILPGGFAGVDVFFVISGFLITRLIDDAMSRGTFDYVEFLWKRCRRILPALLVMLVGTLVLGACILTGPELVGLSRHAIAGAISASNLLLFSEVGYFDTTALGKPLLHLWSLGIEEQFYLAWPLLLWVLPQHRRMRVLSIAALVAGSLLISENLAFSDPSQAFYLLHARAWELGAGGLIAVSGTLVPSSHDEPTAARAALRQVASIIGVTLILATGILVDERSSWPGISALAPVVGAVLVITAGPAAILNRTVLASAPARWIGERSYAFYLWHWPPIAFMHILAAERNLAASTQVWIAACLMLPALALAHVTVLYVERPMRMQGTRLVARRPIVMRDLMPYGVAVAVLAITARVIMLSHGIPARYGAATTDALAALDAASADSITAYGRYATRCQLPDTGNAIWCWRTPGRGKGIAVFGDSHAEVVFAGLADLRGSRPLFLTGRKGCAPLLHSAPIADRLGDICRRASTLAHETIRRDTSIGTVILASRGPAYITGVGFGIDSQRPVVPVAIPRSSGDTSALELAFSTGLERSARSLIDAGKHVIVIIGVPEIGFLPEECLLGRPFGLRALRAPCAVSRSAVDERNARYRHVIRALSMRVPGLEVFDAQPIYCDRHACGAASNGRLLYQDGNHLALAGSRMLAQQLRPILGGGSTGTTELSAR